MKNRVWILLLNWKNAKDTFECLESIKQCQDSEIAGVVLCDNGSNDGSLEGFRQWFSEHEWPFANYVYQDGQFVLQHDGLTSQTKLPVILIDNQANLGFAGGNNVGLQFIMQNLEYEFVYLLNNDTLIQNNTVSAMVTEFEKTPEMGLCGSKVIYSHTPHKVQALGGASFNFVLARAVNIGAMSDVSAPIDTNAVVAKLEYILGASTMVSKSFLEKVGTMEDGYFLYFEEIDWAVRAKRNGFKLGFAKDSIVLHKEGASIGSSYDKNSRSPLSTYYMTRSRAKFTLKFFPQYFPVVTAFHLYQMLRFAFNGNGLHAKTMLKALFFMPFTKP